MQYMSFCCPLFQYSHLDLFPSICHSIGRFKPFIQFSQPLLERISDAKLEIKIRILPFSTILSLMKSFCLNLALRFKVHHSVKLAFEFSHIRSSPRRLGSPARSVDCCCCFAGISICAPKGSRFGHICYFQSSILLYSDVNASRNNSKMMLQQRTLDWSTMWPCYRCEVGYRDAHESLFEICEDNFMLEEYTLIIL